LSALSVSVVVSQDSKINRPDFKSESIERNSSGKDIVSSETLIAINNYLQKVRSTIIIGSREQGAVGDWVLGAVGDWETGRLGDGESNEQ
jgi:hypothetical protein